MTKWSEALGEQFRLEDKYNVHGILGICGIAVSNVSGSSCDYGIDLDEIKAMLEKRVETWDRYKNREYSAFDDAVLNLVKVTIGIIEEDKDGLP